MCTLAGDATLVAGGHRKRHVYTGCGSHTPGKIITNTHNYAHHGAGVRMEVRVDMTSDYSYMYVK